VYELFDALQKQMQRKVPNATLSITTLPQAPEIQLALIDGAYPQASLSQEQVIELMDNPPYWAFCWASGQVMARYLLDHSDVVKKKVVVDFGCGSGVVAIAASMAGAKRTIALDIDSNALDVSRLNADLNHTDIELSSNIDTLTIDKSKATLLIADVFYDAKNIPLLHAEKQCFLENDLSIESLAKRQT
jgi:predicted nicotinamide N-methyase